MNDIEENLKALNIVLPDAPKPMGNFLPYLLDGSCLYISGQVSIDLEGELIHGKLGETLDVITGQKAAECCAIGILARAKAALGNLSRIEKLVKLGGFVNATANFTDHPKVINGASDLMVKILGKERGEHVRFAVGCVSLPSGAAVEIEALFRIKD